MNLLLDIGNSRIKWATLTDGAIAPGETIGLRVESPGEALIGKFAGLPAPQSILVANVAGDSIAGIVERTVGKLWLRRPEFIRVERERMGVRTDYSDAAQLGVDRWLALLAARHGSRDPACVVDCGTAVTVDAMDANGVHLGGWIVPGSDMMRSALVENTREISVEAGSATMEFGLSTSACVNNGSAVAIASLIDRAIAQLSARFGPRVYCIMTGGGATSILPLLENHFHHDPELVFRGLALFAGDR
ncbi:MAG: type III pantothenate kinase [Gammaproteobacteria bacterium]